MDLADNEAVKVICMRDFGRIPGHLSDLSKGYFAPESFLPSQPV